MNAIGYIRVSTQEQGTSGLGMEAQRHDIEDACAVRGWTLVRIYEDVASGSSRNGRHGLADALVALRGGEASALVTARMDRLARSPLDFYTIVEQSTREGWALVVVTPEIDLTTTAGRMLAGILAVIAAWERDMISDRTRASLAAARERGTVLGRPEHLRIPPLVIERVGELRAGGLSWRQVARALDRDGPAPAGGGRSWHPATLQRAYTREAGRG